MMTHESSADSATADALSCGTATMADQSTLVTRLRPLTLTRAEVSARMGVMSNAYGVTRTGGHTTDRKEGLAP